MDINRQRHGSIRNRIFLFSILVTLVPSIGMGWFWYDISSKTTTAKVEQRLRTSADIIDREIDLWFKERNYDLRVFSNAFLVAENLAIYQQQVANTDNPSAEKDEALKKISNYLGFIITKFSNYRRLAILDTGGKVLASSSPLKQEQFMVVPGNWQEQVNRNQYFVGDYFFTDPKGGPLVLIGIPLLAGNDSTVVGFFVLEAYLDTIRSLFLDALPGGRMETGSSITLLEKDGRIIFRSSSAQPPDTGDAADVVTEEPLMLLHRTRVLNEYVDSRNVVVLGMMFSLSDLPWYLLFEEDKAAVYAGLLEARDRILLITALLTVVIGGSAIILARQIISPLRELTTGVQQVANGDLRVAIPVHGTAEFGMVATMFNEMVAQLRESQARLEEMATTDPLTGLANRKQIMTSLELQMEDFCRHETSFAVLMLDIDFFKRVNDTYGHQAGDSVLVGVANILATTLRALDTAGRYGGEEFMVILDRVNQDQAVDTAERIRQSVEEHVFLWQDQELKITVSIGAGTISVSDESINSLISRVDGALYRAKAEGRNRTCSSGPRDDTALHN